ncbi:MAG: hypothetical protein P4N60_11645 [Verrucomicrobiae bacterium]|nr:hypothetical protein [Verrucomicrobiae bacterium]
MKHYAAIHVGTRWANKHPWGVLVENMHGHAELLCVGCTQVQADKLVTKLNGQQEKGTKRKLVTALAGLVVMMLISGCTMAPLKGGKATTAQLAGHITQTVDQGENPAQASRQDQETVRTKSYTVPAGSRMLVTSVTAEGGGAPVTNAQTMILSAPMSVTEHEESRAKTELGAAQKDTARELSAKLASLKGIVWVGLAMFLFGLASMFYPPLKLIIGSVTTSVAILVGGIALMVLPSLIVGNELLILGGVGAAVGVWFFAHRHGQLRGLVDAANNGNNSQGDAK